MNIKLLAIVLFLLITNAGYTQNYAQDFLSWFNRFSAPNFNQLNNLAEKKLIFFNYLRPAIIKENKKILDLRALIKNENLPNQKLLQLKQKYRLKNIKKSTLLKAIDIIPVSMTLAQAAVESSWGRSRFAMNWHNYFGIWCFKEGCGVVPSKRNKNTTHEVAKFTSINKAIKYYMLNINRHQAYQLIRNTRYQLRQKNQKVTGLALSKGLNKYASIGHKYVELIQKIITREHLSLYD
jgi:Bax protein